MVRRSQEANMRMIVLFLSCAWVSCAGAANYPVGSTAEKDAILAIELWRAFCEAYPRKCLEYTYPNLYEIRIEDMPDQLWGLGNKQNEKQKKRGRAPR